MIASNHILGTFDDALGTLRTNVLMMSSLTERSLDRAVSGLLLRDDELCVTAIADDQAGRISDNTAFFYLGRLIEFSETRKMFSNPAQRQTEDYITGRFG